MKQLSVTVTLVGSDLSKEEQGVIKALGITEEDWNDFQEGGKGYNEVEQKVKKALGEAVYTWLDDVRENTARPVVTEALEVYFGGGSFEFLNEAGVAVIEALNPGLKKKRAKGGKKVSFVKK